MSSPEVIGKQFVAAFYQTFDTNRAGLAPLYVRTRPLSLHFSFVQPRPVFSLHLHLGPRSNA